MEKSRNFGLKTYFKVFKIHYQSWVLCKTGHSSLYYIRLKCDYFELMYRYTDRYKIFVRYYFYRFLLYF
jgi:hypothetical protein